MNKPQRRNALHIMGKLIILIRPLIPVMIIAVTAGVTGFLCAIFITVFGGQALIDILRTAAPALVAANIPADLLGLPVFGLTVGTVAVCLILLAVFRGLLHCLEQYCNHYIAFKLLALIRHKVFAALRLLAPAKLEGRDKGNLITIITTDIELLEVFYAHTISPIIIAVLTSICMLVFIGSYNLIACLIAFAGYMTVGAVIPLANGKKTADAGLQFRNGFGDLNSFVLESLRGLDEIIQYDAGSRIRHGLSDRSDKLAHIGMYLSKQEAVQRIQTNTAILFFSFVQLFFSIFLFQQGMIDFSGAIGITLAMISSFGPVLALAQLSNNLHQTLASGDRVLSLLEEAPVITEIPDDGKVRTFEGASVESVSFAYEDEVILRDYSAAIQKNTITGIHGASGSGKSTLLKLLMRFWDVQQGSIVISAENIKTIPSCALRAMEGCVSQESHLFKGTIADNIRIGKLDASIEEVAAAAEKASIHSFIENLPRGYNTPVGELGDTLSGGEKQRIGLARAFLHDAPLLLLDEPTSNLDSLNEKIILKSLKESSAGKTVVLVSHRESTLSIVDTVLKMKQDRRS